MASIYNPLRRPGFNPALVDPNYAQYGFDGGDSENPIYPGDLDTQTANPQSSSSIYGSVGAPLNVNTGQYSGPNGPTGIPTLNTDPNQDIHNSFYADQGIINAGGQQINQEAQNQLKHYDPLQQEYEGKSREALDELKKTPGYTGDEAAKIGVDYSKNKTSSEDLDKRFLSDSERSGITGDPSKALAATYGGTDAEGKILGDYEANLGAQAQNYGVSTDASLGNYRSGVGGAVTGLKSGLDASQDKFSKLDTAVNNPALEFDPNHTEAQLTDRDVDAMRTAAGVRVGNSYQTAKDDLQRSAAAAGSTSPLAIAAARARLEHQSASDSGQAEAAADIAARQAQYQRAADIEKQREGAVGTQTGYKVGAATTEQQQAQNAAALAGTTDVNSQQALGQTEVAAKQKAAQANIDAANASGQTALATRTKMTDQEAAAQNLADQTASSRAAATAANRQNVQAGVTDTQYQQGMATDTANSGGAKTIGDARQQGEGAYRTGSQNQQQMAQTGGQKAVDQQQAAFSTTAGGLNTSTANRANYETGGQGNSALNQATRVVGAVFGHEDGFIATEPEVSMLGENGPELVEPVDAATSDPAISDPATNPDAIEKTGTQKLASGIGNYFKSRFDKGPIGKTIDDFRGPQGSSKKSADKPQMPPPTPQTGKDPGLSGTPTVGGVPHMEGTGSGAASGLWKALRPPQQGGAGAPSPALAPPTQSPAAIAPSSSNSAVDPGQAMQDRIDGTNVDQSGPGGPIGDLNSEFDAGGGLGDLPMYGKGYIVTQPTIAIVGDKGAEKITPLNGSASNNVENMDVGRVNYPIGGVRSRFRHTSGPNSVGKHRPLPNELPLLPNKMQR